MLEILPVLLERHLYVVTLLLDQRQDGTSHSESHVGCVLFFTTSSSLR